MTSACLPRHPAVAYLCLVRPMRVCIAVIAVALICSVTAGSLPDDATLSRLLVGTWQGARHATQYRSDGTWIMDPQNSDLLHGQNTHGKWQIKEGKLIETWRFEGEPSDSSTVDEIIELTSQILRFRTLSQDGPGRPEGLILPSGIYTKKRVKHD